MTTTDPAILVRPARAPVIEILGLVAAMLPFVTYNTLNVSLRGWIALFGGLGAVAAGIATAVMLRRTSAHHTLRLIAMALLFGLGGLNLLRCVGRL